MSECDDALAEQADKYHTNYIRYSDEPFSGRAKNFSARKRVCNLNNSGMQYNLQ